MKVMQGIVYSAKTPQTAIVTVTRRWQHPLYKKYVKRTKNYACHLEADMKVEEGDTVTIQECKPISKTKHFIVTAKVADGTAAMVETVDPSAEVVKTVKKAVKAKK